MWTIVYFCASSSFWKFFWNLVNVCPFIICLWVPKEFARTILECAVELHKSACQEILRKNHASCYNLLWSWFIANIEITTNGIARCTPYERACFHSGCAPVVLHCSLKLVIISNSFVDSMISLQLTIATPWFRNTWMILWQFAATNSIWEFTFVFRLSTHSLFTFMKKA